MSLRSILTGIGDAYLSIRDDKRKFEGAMDEATVLNRVHGKVILHPQQVVTLKDGERIVVFDDGSSRRAAAIGQAQLR